MTFPNILLQKVHNYSDHPSALIRRSILFPYCENSIEDFSGKSSNQNAGTQKHGYITKEEINIITNTGMTMKLQMKCLLYHINIQ